MAFFDPNLPRTIDPTVDRVFKMLLGNEEHKELTLSFLNAVLGLKGKDRLVEIEYLNPFLPKAHVDDKTSIVDIKVKDGNDNAYQIEIQNRYEKYQDARVFHNWSKLAAASLVGSEYYNKLRASISIWIMGGHFLPRETTDAVRLKYTMHCPEIGHSLCPQSYIVVFQLPNLVDNGKLDEDLVMWLRIFKEGKHIDPNHPPEWAQRGISKEVMEVLRYIANDRDEYLRYDSLLKARRETEGLADFSAAAVRAQNEERLAKEEALARLAEERRAKENERRAKENERRAKEAALNAQEAERLGKEMALKGQEAERLEKEAALKGQEAERLEKEAALIELERLRALLGKSLES